MIFVLAISGCSQRFTSACCVWTPHLGTFAPRNLGVLRKDAVPYRCLSGMGFFERTVEAGSKPAQKWFEWSIGYVCHLGTFATLYVGMLRKNAVSGTSRTPSPTLTNDHWRAAYRCHISGRLHLVTSACCARTPYLGTFAPRNLGVLRMDAVPYRCLSGMGFFERI